LRVRLSALGAEHRQSANAFADRVRAEAEAELQRLRAERGLPYEWNVPSRRLMAIPTTFEQTPPARRPFIRRALMNSNKRGRFLKGAMCVQQTFQRPLSLVEASI